MSVLTAPPDAATMAGLTHSQPQTAPAAATFLALDPGVTTGWCLARWLPENNRLLLTYSQNQFSLLDLFHFTSSILFDVDEYTIIYETFEYRNKARAGLNLTPVKMIGIVELQGESFPNILKLYPQNAAQGKGFWKDDKLKKYELYKPGVQHGRDAARHMLHFFTFGPGAQYINDIDKIDIDLVDLELLVTAYYPSMRIIG
jgi:hypothetical protein